MTIWKKAAMLLKLDLHRTHLHSQHQNSTPNEISNKVVFPLMGKTESETKYHHHLTKGRLSQHHCTCRTASHYHCYSWITSIIIIIIIIIIISPSLSWLCCSLIHLHIGVIISNRVRPLLTGIPLLVREQAIITKNGAAIGLEIWSRVSDIPIHTCKGWKKEDERDNSQAKWGPSCHSGAIHRCW